MFVILLKFSSNKARASEFMAEHKAWLQRGFDEGIFVASGSLRDQTGGCVIARGVDEAGLQRWLNEDPFVGQGVVSAQVIDIALSKTVPPLDFLSASAPD